MMAMLGGHVDKGSALPNLVELFCIRQIVKRHYLRVVFNKSRTSLDEPR